MMKSSDPAELHARLLALFEGPLAGVRFPDVDADILSAHVRGAKDAAARLEGARAALEDARQALAEEEAKLDGRVERALAYLRVYADGDPALLVELEAMSDQLQPRAATSAPSARRRGRQVRASEVLALDARAQPESRVAVAATALAT